MSSAPEKVRSGREYPPAPIPGVAAVVFCGDEILLIRRGRVQYHYVLVEWLCLASERSAPICGDDAAEALWVPCRDVFSDAYDLGEATLGVIRKALQLRR